MTEGVSTSFVVNYATSGNESSLLTVKMDGKIIMSAIVDNTGQVIKRETKDYSFKEIAGLIASHQRSSNLKRDDRYIREKPYVYASLIANLEDNDLKNVILLAPDNNDIESVEQRINARKKKNNKKGIINFINKAMNRKKDKGIMFIPYMITTAELGHATVMVVDLNKYPEANSIKCFDSSHAATEQDNLTKEDLIKEDYLPKSFTDRYPKIVDRVPINTNILQNDESNCSYYSESFIKWGTEYIQSFPDSTLDTLKTEVNQDTTTTRLQNIVSELENNLIGTGYCYKKNKKLIHPLENDDKNDLKTSLVGHSSTQHGKTDIATKNNDNKNQGVGSRLVGRTDNAHSEPIANKSRQQNCNFNDLEETPPITERNRQTGMSMDNYTDSDLSIAIDDFNKYTDYSNREQYEQGKIAGMSAQKALEAQNNLSEKSIDSPEPGINHW